MKYYQAVEGGTVHNKNRQYMCVRCGVLFKRLVPSAREPAPNVYVDFRSVVVLTDSHGVPITGETISGKDPRDPDFCVIDALRN